MLRHRRLLLVVLGLVVVVGILGTLARIYLSSQHLTGQVATRLQALYGAPVELREANLGLSGSSLRDLQLFEAASSSAAGPWLIIDQAQAEIPLWKLLQSGAMPSELTLRGVTITLRFDRAGHLLTRIPTEGQTSRALPAITLDDGRIVLQQEGRPDFVLTGIHSTLQEQVKQLTLKAAVADPTWGNWTVDGNLDRAAESGSATVRTPEVHVTQAMLEQLPFVPTKIWQEVKLEADAAIDAVVRADVATEKWHYGIHLKSRGGRVDLPTIELHAELAQGKALVQDGHVSLDDVHVHAADGDIRASGEVEFAHTPWQMDFKVDASRLELTQLPKSWRLPPWGGRLSGHADLQLTVADGKIQTSGSGEGAITGVRVPGATESKPILLKLHPTGEGFRFSSGVTASNMNQQRPWLPATLLTTTLLAAQRPEPSSSPFPSPAQLVNWFGSAVLHSVDAVASSGSNLLGRLPSRRTSTAAAPQKAPSYLEAQLGLDQVDVAQLIQGLKVPVPFPITGRISFNVQLGVPLDTPRELRTYRLRGSVTSTGLNVAGQELRALRAKIAYAEGLLRLEELTGQIPAGPTAGTGSFAGTAQLQVIPAGELTAQLTLKMIPLAGVLAREPTLAAQAQGDFSGSMQLRVPAAQLKEIKAWEASGTLRSQRLQLLGMALHDAVVPLRVQGGAASIAAAQGRFEQTPITLTAQLQLAQPYPFTGQFRSQKFDLAAFQQLATALHAPVTLGGQLGVTADAKGTLRPPVFQTTGTGTAENLRVDQLQIGTLHFRWTSDVDRVQVTDLQAHLYGGTLSGGAVLPLRAGTAGTLDVRVQDLDVGALSKAVPNVPLRLEGHASGRLEGTLPAVQAGRPRAFTSKLELQAPQLRVQGIPTERLHGTVDYQDQSVHYRLEGETLGGRFHLDGQIPPAHAPPAEPAPEGQLQVEGVRLSRLSDVLHLPATAGSLHGLVRLTASFRHSGRHGAPIGSGVFSITGLRWGETNLSPSLQGEVLLREGEVRLANLSGEFAQGFVRGQLRLNLQQFERSWFSLTLDQVEAARLLAPWPELADQVQGLLQIRLRSTFGRDWYGGGEIALGRGRVFGAEVVDLRLPLDWAIAPAFGSGQLEVRESNAQVALGRVVTRASIAWGGTVRVEGQSRFFGLELRSLVRQTTTLSQMGTGQISGRFDFSGSDVRSLDDLTGTIDARLQQTQALQLPILQQLAPFLLGGQSSSSVFQSGNLRGRLARGALRIDQLTFTGSMVQLFVAGTVTLQRRLDLEVTANTGNLGVNPNFVRFLGLRIPAIGPIPVTLLMEASTYFSNRLVHLRVTGTVRAPIITVEPISLLGEEAVRYFLNRSSLPLP